jgi:hypothetical protein
MFLLQKMIKKQGNIKEFIFQPCVVYDKMADSTAS